MQSVINKTMMEKQLIVDLHLTTGTDKNGGGRGPSPPMETRQHSL